MWEKEPLSTYYLQKGSALLTPDNRYTIAIKEMHMRRGAAAQAKVVNTVIHLIENKAGVYYLAEEICSKLTEAQSLACSN